MSDDTNNVWRSIAEDGAEVPVTIHTPVTSTTTSAPVQSETSYVRVNPSMNGSMSLAAMSGILLVLLSGATFYFGTDFLRASISTTHSTASVIITKTGTFDPPQIDITPGDTLRIQNENENPQLLKGKDETGSMFGEQMIFPGESFTYDLPLDAPVGTYSVVSDILPGQLLAVTIAEPAVSSMATSESSLSANADSFMDNVLIPSLSDLSAPSSNSAIPAASSSITQPRTSPPAQTSLPPQQIPLPQQPIETRPLNNTIETNPFTVGTMKNRPLPGQSSSKKALHGGAPLITRHTPRSSSQTGPGTWLVCLLILFSAGFVRVRTRRTIW